MNRTKLMVTIPWYSLIIFSCVLLNCTPELSIPQVTIVSFPAYGDTTTTFTLDASGSTDETTVSDGLLCRWDLDGDSIYETLPTKYKKACVKFKEFGDHTIRCEVSNFSGGISSNSLIIKVKPVFKDSVFIDQRDGQLYPAAYVDGLWIMARNLTYGKRLNSGEIPASDTIPEFFTNPEHPNYGGYYTLGESTYYGRDTVRGICPEGWYLPTKKEYQFLLFRIYLRENNAYYFGEAGSLKTHFTETGFYYYPTNLWCSMEDGLFWMKQDFSDSYLKQYRYLIYKQGDISYQEWATRFDDVAFHCGSVNYKLDLFKQAVPVRCMKYE